MKRSPNSTISVIILGTLMNIIAILRLFNPPEKVPPARIQGAVAKGKMDPGKLLRAKGQKGKSLAQDPKEDKKVTGKTQINRFAPLNLMDSIDNLFDLSTLVNMSTFELDISETTTGPTEIKWNFRIEGEFFDIPIPYGGKGLLLQIQKLWKCQSSGLRIWEGGYEHEQ